MRMTTIIKKPNEIEELKKIYNDHAKASEAKINEEKTQIFKLGEKMNEKEEKEANIYEKIRPQVTILGAKTRTQTQN